MPTQRLEPAAAGVTFLASVWSLLAALLDWMTKNTATISVIAIVIGLAIQFYSSRRNRAKMDADERRAQEEHELQMEIMRRELAEHRPVGDPVEVTGK